MRGSRRLALSWVLLGSIAAQPALGQSPSPVASVVPEVGVQVGVTGTEDDIAIGPDEWAGIAAALAGRPALLLRGPAPAEGAPEPAFSLVNVAVAVQGGLTELGMTVASCSIAADEIARCIDDQVDVVAVVGPLGVLAPTVVDLLPPKAALVQVGATDLSEAGGDAASVVSGQDTQPPGWSRSALLRS